MPLPNLPPAISGQPPMGAAPVGPPTGNPGLQAEGLAKLREAIKIITDALKSFPPGSEPFTKAASALSTLSRLAAPGDEVPGVQQSALRDLQSNAGQNAMLQQVIRAMGAGGGQPGMPGAPGAAPPAM